MWSSPGANIDNNNTSNSKVSGNSPSKCFSSTCSSPSPFSPSPPIPNQSMNGASMEEVWDDINLASLHDHSNTNTSSNTNHHSFNGMVFQDFLARPSNKDTSTRAASKEPSSGGGNSFLKNSLGPPPATMLSLNSGSDHFHYLESSNTVPVRPNPQMHSHANGGTISFDSSLDSPFDALGSSSVFLSICKKRPQENGDVSGGDRRHKRMIKNRESAARSRARKQAYTVELEREAAHLAQENAKLRRQQERFLAAAPAQLVGCGRLNRRKDDEELQGRRASSKQAVEFNGEEELVCVTSGVSYLGVAIVNRLLTRGYSVRIIVDNEEDKERLRELETSGEMRTSKNGIDAVMAKLTEVESLVEAFQGCHGVFHTSAFTDPAGLSGYTKSMAEIEVKASENVMEACSRTPSVRNCVVTSSLLTCLWRDTTAHELPPVVNHESWSDESLCIRKKLWYAVGKLRAEKAAWKRAEERGLKLATICPGLITGPEYFGRNPTATIAYLKGGQEMFKDGLLATVDVMKLAEAHTSVFEAMNKTACGRYICFDRVIQVEDEAERLAMEIGISANQIVSEDASNCGPARFVLSNKKLCNLMSRTHRNCYNQS